MLPLLQGADQTITDIEGDPVAWPVALAGDKGYRADWIDEALLELGIRPVVPSKENEDRDNRLVKFDREAYRRRMPEPGAGDAADLVRSRLDRQCADAAFVRR